MDRIGFFGEHIGFDVEQDSFFSLYKSALCLSFPQINIDSFSNIKELVDFQYKNSKTQAFWGWMKKEGLELLNCANSQIISCIQNKVDVDNIYKYQKMVIEDVSENNTPYENIDILIDCLIGYKLAISTMCNKNKYDEQPISKTVQYLPDDKYIKYHVTNKEGTANAVSFLFVMLCRHLLSR